MENFVATVHGRNPNELVLAPYDSRTPSKDDWLLHRDCDLCDPQACHAVLKVCTCGCFQSLEDGICKSRELQNYARYAIEPQMQAHGSLGPQGSSQALVVREVGSKDDLDISSTSKQPDNAETTFAIDSGAPGASASRSDLLQGVLLQMQFVSELKDPPLAISGADLYGKTAVEAKSASDGSQAKSKPAGRSAEWQHKQHECNAMLQLTLCVRLSPGASQTAHASVHLAFDIFDTCPWQLYGK